MNTPEFFDLVPSIVLRDPLAEFLGASEGGRLEYHYLDAVKLAGHSCPTVASAYALTRLGLVALWGEALPERGALRVEFREPLTAGVTGVIANVVAMLTGAAGEGGFMGLAGRFERRELMAFGRELPLALRFTRLDDGSRVELAAHLQRVPADPRMPELMQRCLAGRADADERREFGRLWQQRVRRVLLEHGDDPEVFELLPLA